MTMSGLVGAHQREQVDGVGELGDDLEAGLGEEAGHALAHQGGVVGDDQAHGISAVTLVPVPG